MTPINTICKLTPQVPSSYYIYRNEYLLDTVESTRDTLFTPFWISEMEKEREGERERESSLAPPMTIVQIRFDNLLFSPTTLIH